MVIKWGIPCISQVQSLTVSLNAFVESGNLEELGSPEMSMSGVKDEKCDAITLMEVVIDKPQWC